ncbi:hypothetical protein A3D00_02915 [Candidatus Woesebacteria bacterium RIFCSPHIGHO2_02_FULL_38_9]|uniref:AbiEi antitoxin C-terminal domain-containing protein n=1 Tax=Candidatus Woesebacteria bacterium RIFCSPHIGHO2_01_FULL_39_28 TaxID=1802496 RepID=A0A1F7YFP4_9BACT|nr:MAG: hypothetical protein A2627_03870 [Candidatus Woesebacteria bacterium RIFCSPHIGHO2_01_FULL_39_28]OGM35335.1 MAG: hypothetical protein A3D00_02915 [Candidatus Woesebacteria bacterium RIFCSPHIGHO2_02_FULL_38_9]OGM57231.1 MAG: hypothetical protein A3A50_00430 [Candidatus Woesebacteria bacterium RIFCSPLOWO2_01_FULL_38_20]
MKITNFLTEIGKIQKPFYRMVDFEKIFEQDRMTVNKSIERLIKAGVINRLMKNVYVVRGQEENLEQVANLIYKPSYLSFESVLYKHGVVNQPPFGITFATTRRSKKIELGKVECWYSQIKVDLWWGFYEKNGFLEAEVEKAIVDMLYLRERGKRRFETDEWYWSGVDRKKLKTFISRAGLKDRKLTE